MLIDASYFEADLSIGQITDQAVAAAMNLFIAKYEEDFLTSLFGYPLYKAFQAGIAADPIEDKWASIKSGKEYTYNGNLKKYRGILMTSGSLKRSPIANYVYFKYQKDNASFTTGSGERKPKSAVSINVSPGIKMIRAWNEMVKWNREFIEFMEYSYGAYPEYDNYPMDSNRYFLLQTINQFGI